MRVAVALRGARPTAAELAAVRADPSAIAGIVDTYLAAPEFGALVRDVWNEALLLRVDVNRFVLPAVGPLAERGTRGRVPARGLGGAAAPDRVRRGNDRPFGEIVTADYAIASELGDRSCGAATPMPPTPARPPAGWQKVAWDSGQPMAGILSSGALWLRHPSNGTNLHRGQAELVSEALLCSGFLGRDVPLFNNIDLSDEEVVKTALTTSPGCVSCHQTLDPLASHLFGFQRVGHVRKAYDKGDPTCAKARSAGRATRSPSTARSRPVSGARRPGARPTSSACRARPARPRAPRSPPTRASRCARPAASTATSCRSTRRHPRRDRGRAAGRVHRRRAAGQAAGQGDRPVRRLPGRRRARAARPRPRWSAARPPAPSSSAADRRPDRLHLDGDAATGGKGKGRKLARWPPGSARSRCCRPTASATGRWPAASRASRSPSRASPTARPACWSCRRWPPRPRRTWSSRTSPQKQRRLLTIAEATPPSRPCAPRSSPVRARARRARAAEDPEVDAALALFKAGLGPAVRAGRLDPRAHGAAAGPAASLFH
jgi:hypothetical protein